MTSDTTPPDDLVLIDHPLALKILASAIPTRVG